MKKPLKVIIYLLMAVPVLFIGCQKSELLDNSSNSNVQKSKVVDPVTSTINCNKPCGTPLKANLYIADASTAGDLFGTLTVSNDANKLYLKYTLSEGSSYFLNGLIYYVGLESGLPDGGAIINPGVVGWPTLTPEFPQQWGMGDKSHTVEIDLNTLPDCFIIVAFARVSLNATIITNDPTLKYISARPIPEAGLKTHQGFFLNYCKQFCESGCETAYAFGNRKAHCFLTIQGIRSNNWGWTNGPLCFGKYDWPIYAGAGRCDISKGTKVGTLHVEYIGSTAVITYEMNINCHLSATHLWVGKDFLPKKRCDYITAPGQFPYKHENLNGAVKDTYTITGLTGLIYIAAHSEVCW